MNHFYEKTVLQTFQFVAYIKSPRRELNSAWLFLSATSTCIWLSLFICIYYSVCYFFNLEFVWLLYIRNVTFEFV